MESKQRRVKRVSETAQQLMTDVWGEETWAEFVDGIQAIYEHHTDHVDDRQAALARLIDEMYPVLLTDPALQQAIARCPQSCDPTRPGWWSTLHESAMSHIALVAVYQGQAMPLHDHPGSHGLSVVLTGRAQVRQASIAELNPANGVAKIKLDSIEEMAQQQFSWFDESHSNLHSIEAMTPIAHILAVHLPPIRRQEQAYYFPLETKQWLPGQSLSTKRVKIRNNFGH